MQSARDRSAGSHSVFARGTWKDAHLLNDVRELNEQALEVLSAAALRGRPDLPRAVSENRMLWRVLTPAARCRAAQMPILLLDLHFLDAGWWRERLRQDCLQGLSKTVTFRGEQGLPELTRQILMLLWPAAKSHPSAARLMFGMVESVAGIVASLSTRRLDMVISQFSLQLRLRWAESPEFWRPLLVAAQEDDTAALREMQLRALQRLCAQMMTVRTHARSGQAV